MLLPRSTISISHTLPVTNNPLHVSRYFNTLPSRPTRVLSVLLPPSYSSFLTLPLSPKLCILVDIPTRFFPASLIGASPLHPTHHSSHSPCHEKRYISVDIPTRHASRPTRASKSQIPPLPTIHFPPSTNPNRPSFRIGSGPVESSRVPEQNRTEQMCRVENQNRQYTLHSPTSKTLVHLQDFSSQAIWKPAHADDQTFRRPTPRPVAGQQIPIPGNFHFLRCGEVQWR